MGSHFWHTISNSLQDQILKLQDGYQQNCEEAVFLKFHEQKTSGLSACHFLKENTRHQNRMEKTSWEKTNGLLSTRSRDWWYIF